ncbi:MAG: outer membrane protein assembly factor BamD, partial [Anaerolineaceae bacterium]|nr:outer membrane protein assembly factor BamD [Anaerolineaceae bacterium]
MMKQTLTFLLALMAAGLLVVPAAAQRSGRRNQRNQQQEEKEEKKPLTRAQKAHKMYSDAEALRQTGRGKQAAELFESMIKEHPTSELVPEAMAKAAQFYGSTRTPKGKRMVALMRKNFPNNRHTLSTYWNPIEAATARESTVPVKERIALLEEYLDRYWAQSHFSDAVQRLAKALVQDGQTENADALLSHALAETSPAGMGGMINMIQRGSGRRKDYDNLAKVWGNAAKSVDNRTPVYPLLALLEIGYLVKADSLDEAMKKTEAIQKLRPKSEFAAYCALEVRPKILARQEKWSDVAAALGKAIKEFGIFALPGHTQRLADYEAKAGNTAEALKLLDKLLAQPNWPWKTRELLDTKYGLLSASGDLAAANQVNGRLAALFPQTAVALQVRLRTVSNLITSEKIPQASTALGGLIKDFPNSPTAAKSVYAYFARFDARSHEAELKALKDEFLKAYPASAESDEIRKQRDVALEDSPTAKAQEVFEEYKSFAGESNVEAARRRIEKLFKEYPSSPHGSTACSELAKALKDADKV